MLGLWDIGIDDSIQQSHQITYIHLRMHQTSLERNLNETYTLGEFGGVLGHKKSYPDILHSVSSSGKKKKPDPTRCPPDVHCARGTVGGWWPGTPQV